MTCDWCESEIDLGDKPGRCPACDGAHWQCPECKLSWAASKAFCSSCGKRRILAVSTFDETPAPKIRIVERPDESAGRSDINVATAWGFHTGGRDFLCGTRQVLVTPPMKGGSNCLFKLNSPNKEATLSAPALLNESVLVLAATTGAWAISVVNGTRLPIVPEGSECTMAPLVQRTGEADYLWLCVDTRADRFYWIPKDDVQNELVSFDQLHSLVQSGTLDGNTQVWQEGWTDWAALGEVAELAPLLRRGCPRTAQKLCKFKYYSGKCMGLGSFELVREYPIKTGKRVLGGWLYGLKARFLLSDGSRCEFAQESDPASDDLEFDPAPVNPKSFVAPLRVRFTFQHNAVWAIERSANEHMRGITNILKPEDGTKQAMEQVKPAERRLGAPQWTTEQALIVEKQRESVDRLWCSLGAGAARAGWVPVEASYLLSCLGKDLYANQLKGEVQHWPADQPGPIFRAPSGATTAFISEDRLIWWHIEKAETS